LTVEILATPEELDELFKLRFAAWKTRRDLSPECPDGRLTDAHDRESIHFGIRESCKLAAAASIHVALNHDAVPEAGEIRRYLRAHDPPFHMFRRLVVAPSARRSGHASTLDRARVAYFLKHTDTGTAMVIISSAFRVEKLARLGFRQACPIGDFHTYPGGPSTLLIATRQDLAAALTGHPFQPQENHHDPSHRNCRWRGKRGPGFRSIGP
jgi:hypothetical protein